MVLSLNFWNLSHFILLPFVSNLELLAGTFLQQLEKVPKLLCEMIRQDAVLVGRPPWVAAAGGHHLPGFGSPGSGEPGTLGTHHHPGPADQTLNLPEPANYRIKTNTQDGCQNFRFNALPM